MAMIMMSLIPLLIAAIVLTAISFCNSTANGRCIPQERNTLLEFKRGLTDPSKRLASWASEVNCCSWFGVVCDNFTGHVLELRLQGPTFLPKDLYHLYYPSGDYVKYRERSTLGGNISESLLELKHLTYLDLSSNYFQGISIPKFFGSMTSLRFLNLSTSEFGGSVPHQLGNLSNLQSLVIQSEYPPSLSVDRLDWTSGLSSLKFLDLSGVDLIEAFDWVESLGQLPSLEQLRLSNCGLNEITKISNVNFSSLSVLDLSHNLFMSESVLNWISSLTSLAYLDLSWGSLGRTIPTPLLNLTSLRGLYLSENQYDSIPNWIGGFTHLELLDMSSNMFLRGEIPTSIGNLTSLKTLDLSYDNLAGEIPSSIGNLAFLTTLDLSTNQFVGEIPRSIGNLTSLVTLDLSVNYFVGDIPGSIGNLTFLSTIDLFDNQFVEHIPCSIGNLASLTKLNLSNNNFVGEIPSTFGNLTSLRSLDLSFNEFVGEIPSSIGHLAFLTTLDLSHNDFVGEIPGTVGNLTSLVTLSLAFNKFVGKIPSSVGNASSLSTLHLSYNNFIVGEIPVSFKSLCNLRSLGLSNTRMSQGVDEVIQIFSECTSNKLESLDLSNSRFSGHLTDLLKNFKSLFVLNLSNNSIVGTLPISFGDMTSLTSLDLSRNKLNGSIPSSLGRLENLKELNVSDNFLEGEVFEVHFRNLQNLDRFDASGNRLVLRVNPDWIPPFQLVEGLYLRSWEIGPQFPSWLRYLNRLHILDLSDSNISGRLPNWFYGLSDNLLQFNLSHNHMYGKIYNFSKVYTVVDLSSNHFDGPLPFFSAYPFWIDLSHNFFSGAMHNFLCPTVQDQSLAQSIGTSVLILKENFLHGKMPDCWMCWPDLVVVDLSNNNISGNIPKSIGSSKYLKILNLHNNNLMGEMPTTLQNWTDLVVLDVGKNELTGEIPSQIWEQLTKLKIMNLRGNKIIGQLSKELCNLTYLQILDVADNDLNGTIPTCVGNLMGMSDKINSSTGITIDFSGLKFMGSFSIVRKGQVFEYNTTLAFVQSLDLSNNNFVGDIPEGITKLSELQSLNLSHNFLRGRIPKDIGAMKLESLDLSRNQLSGEIPPSMSSMTFLSNLNLSYNNLSGQIPSSTQLQTLNASGFIGNNLCGPPLTKDCNKKDITPPSDHGNETGKVDWFYFYVSLGPGFVAGFWCVVGPLAFNVRRRRAYFIFLDLLWDKVWVWYHLYVVRRS